MGRRSPDGEVLGRMNDIAKDVRTPKYRSRVVKDKRKEAKRRACRKSVK